MQNRRVVIAGGGIAGPALAYWLRQYGLHPLVVERAPTLRRAGQNVDLRGAGREVLRRMGLEDDVRAAGTGEAGVLFTDDTGRIRARMPARIAGGDGFTAELEILRGELGALLYERTRDTADYVFADRITAVDDTGPRARVRLASGAEHEADVVVAADGIGSPTRDLVFGAASPIRSLGLSIAYLTIPREQADTQWAVWQNYPGGRSILLRPDNLGTTRALLTVVGPPMLRGLDPAAQQELFARRFADVGGVGPRVLAALGESAEFYAEDIAQVRLPAWSRGRTVLLGDAAYCASPISGMGTSLALVGAYLLARELARHADPAEAFARYENRMRPYVDRAQKLPPGAGRLTNPQSRTGIRTLHAGIRLLTSAPVAGMFRRVFAPPAETITLPEPASPLS